MYLLYAGGTIDGRSDEKDGDVHRRNHGWRQVGVMCFWGLDIKTQEQNTSPS